jgi:hypothetical protein
VLVKNRGASRFARLTRGASIPVGSVVNASDGAVRLTSAANRAGKRQTAVFHSGSFLVTQKRTRRPITDIALRGALPSCAPSSGAVSSARRTRRGIWGRGHGRFRTRGRHGAGTVRGTVWFTADTCSGTLVKVKRGVVSVKDFARGRTVRVSAGRSYLARAAGRRR